VPPFCVQKNSHSRTFCYKLEYCCSVWNPHFRKDIELIEGFQRRATKLVKDVEHLHYNDRLEHLGLMCLHTRRTRSDLIDTYKIINGIYQGLKTLFVATRSSYSELRTSCCSRSKDKRILWSFRTMTERYHGCEQWQIHGGRRWGRSPPPPK